MLLLLVSLPLLSYAEWGLENFAVDNRFVIPIDTCINNVTKNGVSQTFQDYGSLVCRCSQGKGPTTSGAACFYYADPDCVGDFTDFDSWGGCDNRASTPIIYTVEGCSTAQEVAATTQCAYAVRNIATTYINNKIFPIGPCLDYQCASTNGDPDSRSCSYECDSGAIERTDYSDYTCDNAEGTPTPTPSIDNKVCTPTPTCGVTVTSYTAGTTVYECGSKKSPFKTSRDLSSKTSNYILLENDLRPTPIGQCAETRRGYYSFSTKYMCIEDDILEDVYTVELWKFLGNGDCEDTGDNTYLIETYVPENNTFVCGKSDSKGRIGYYGDCENPNWKSWYSDSLTMFGTCLNFRSDPLTKASDESPEGDQPWYQNLRYVISCNLGKAYPSVYVYVTADCTGDYLFYWDADNYYTAKQYSGQDCAYPQVRNCGNTLDQVSNGKLPSKVKTCQST